MPKDIKRNDTPAQSDQARELSRTGSMNALADNTRAETARADALKEKKAEQARHTRRRNRQLLGFFLSLLIVIGVVSIVQRGVGFIEEIFDNATEREEYRQRVEVMVWFDFLPFDDIRQVDQNALKQVSIWSVFNQRELAGNILRNEDGEALISVIQINMHAAGLFGGGFSYPTHMTFTEPVQDMTYQYDADAQVYAMPITSPGIFYYPKVVDIQREDGGRRRVTVGYLAATNEDDIIYRNPEENDPVKYMDFIFQRDGRDYYLVALEKSLNYSAPAASASPGPSQQPEDAASSSVAAGG